MTKYLADKCEAILKEMGADPETSAVNNYSQMWDVENLFVVGASSFPQNAGYNPTGTVGALSTVQLKVFLSIWKKADH